MAIIKILQTISAGEYVEEREYSCTEGWNVNDTTIMENIMEISLKSRNKFAKWPHFSSVQSLSRIWLFVTPWITGSQVSLFITNSRSSFRFTPIESVMPSSHLILGHPLLLLSPIPPSIRVFSNESTLHLRWPKYWSFNFSIIPSKEIPGLISFRMDWLISLQSKGLSRVFSNSTIQKHQLFGAQLSSQSSSHIHTYMTTGKTIAFTRRTFVGNVMSLLFNMLSRLVITFLPRSKHLLISWLQSPSAVILEPKKIKSDTVSTVSPSISSKWWDQMPWS